MILNLKSSYRFYSHTGIILTIVPSILCLLFIGLYGVNVAHWDQWEFIPLLDKFQHGTLSFSDCFAQHNEHRIFFPRLAMLLIASITNYNNLAEMFFGWILLCIICYLLYSIYSKISQTNKIKYGIISFIPVAWVVFSFRQWENLLWGWQIQIFMAVLFFILAIYLLERMFIQKTKKCFTFILAVLSGIVSSFSFANGLLTWPIGLVQILISYRLKNYTEKRLFRITGWAWGLIGVLVCLLYFIGYNKVGHHPSLFYFLRHPMSSFSYLVVSIGSPLAVEKYTATGLGSLLLFLYFYMIIFFVMKKYRNEIAIPYFVTTFSLVLFSILSAILLTLGRSGFGVEQALSSRYITITMLGVIGIYFFALNITSINFKFKNIIFGMLLSLIIIGIISSYLWGIKEGKETRKIRSINKYYLITYNFQSDENLKRLYPNALEVRKRAQILEKYKLNVFADPYPDLKKLYFTDYPALYYIDSINNHSGSNFFSIDSIQEPTITISGWAVDQQAKKQAGDVFVTIDDKLDIPALYGLDRKDVADHFKNKHYRFSGFQASFLTAALDKGQHSISLKILTADKKGYYIANPGIVLEIK